MSLSFRARVLLLVLAVAVLPLGLVGLWLTGSAARSGEALLRSRLEAALDADARALELSWLRHRSALLDLSETPVIQRALRTRAGAPGGPVPDTLRASFAALDPPVDGMVLRDRTGGDVWRLGRSAERPAEFAAFGSLLTTAVPLFDVPSGAPLGHIEALVPINALRRPSAAAAAISAVMTARDPATGALLLPAPFDPALLAQPHFEWNGEAWIVLRRTLADPAVELIAAAPIAPFALPFRSAARRGTMVLLIAAALGLATAGVITARLTRSLEQLAAAAGAVAEGELGRRVDVYADDEIGRVARAFNAMTDSLRRTLDQLAERESLAAVNEFAAALAHEVRNPLTAIRLDLQEVEERLAAGSPLRALQARALDDVARLDRTVAGALATARTGPIQARDIDLREPVRAAVRAAGPAFDARGARLSWNEPIHPTMIRGDPDALERVFLNLLLNAAQAVEADGHASVELRGGEGDCTVLVRDSGRGISPEALERIFEPFFTTRPGGTGVGLAVARRIVTAHRGEITVTGEPGRGATAMVRLPRGTT